VASVLKADLEAAGAKAIMTRTDKNAIAPTKDQDMAKRREITQKNNPDLFISIHMNMENDPSFKGPILMFQQGSIPGEELAKAITNGINSNIKTLFPCKYRSADLIVLRGNVQPSVLVECGFISNQEEEKKLLQDSYQKEFARAVVYGIEGFYKNQ
jgi:N-acetylmuramoyl-L-alanine amidase